MCAELRHCIKGGKTCAQSYAIVSRGVKHVRRAKKYRNAIVSRGEKTPYV